LQGRKRNTIGNGLQAAVARKKKKDNWNGFI